MASARVKLIRTAIGVVLLWLLRKRLLGKRPKAIESKAAAVANKEEQSTPSFASSPTKRRVVKRKSTTSFSVAAPTLAVAVGGPRMNPSKGYGYAEFPVTLIDSNGTVLRAAWRRYSEFVEFRKNFGKNASQLPAKKVFGKADETFLEQRRVGLERFLKTLLEADASCSGPALQNFLGQELPPPTPSSRLEVTLQSVGEQEEEVSEYEDEEEDAVGEEEKEADVINGFPPADVIAALKPTFECIEQEMADNPKWEKVAEVPSFKLFLEKGTAPGLVSTKAIGEIPAPMDAVLHLLQDTSRKAEYEPEFAYETVLSKFDDDTIAAGIGRNVFACDIRHNVSNSKFPKLIGPRDSVFAECRTRLDDGRVIIALRSMLHEAAPEMASHIRADIHAIGMILEPLDLNRTGYTSIMKVDLKGNMAVPNWILKRLIPKDGIDGYGLLVKASSDQSKWPSHLASREN